MIIDDELVGRSGITVNLKDSQFAMVNYASTFANATAAIPYTPAEVYESILYDEICPDPDSPLCDVGYVLHELHVSSYLLIVAYVAQRLPPRTYLERRPIVSTNQNRWPRRPVFISIIHPALPWLSSSTPSLRHAVHQSDQLRLHALTLRSAVLSNLFFPHAPHSQCHGAMGKASPDRCSRCGSKPGTRAPRRGGN